MNEGRTLAATERLTNIGATAQDHLVAQREALDVLCERIRFDIASFSTVDPATVLWTSCVLSGIDQDPHREMFMFENEYRQEDLLKVSELARGAVPAARLSAISPDTRTTSPRYQAISSAGVVDELRCALTDAGNCWGSFELYRTQGSGCFSDRDIRVAAALAEPLARMIRLSLLRQAAVSPSVDANSPAILVLNRDGTIDSMSSACEGWFNEIGTSSEVPSVARSALARLASGGDDFLTAPVPRRSGGWLHMHGARLHAAAGQKFSFVFEPVKPTVLADSVARAYGFTPRECQVLSCMARGLSTKEIGTWLDISPYTVNDHAKALFQKAGVQSRQQLIAAIFFDQCLPMRQRQAVPGPYGWFLEPVPVGDVGEQAGVGRGRR